MQAAECLSNNGVFSKKLDGFMAREGQQALSEAIENVLSNGEVLVAEAGTGIGKTFAYLVPALLSGQKILISTGTRHLQDQLYHRDLPVVMNALDISVPVSLLKGRSNYLCLHRMKLSADQGYLNAETQDHLQQIRRWSKSTASGDIAQMVEITEDARAWPMVTSTSDNCLGAECPDWTDCFVVKARRDAQEADVVVVNHHLLLADMAIKEEGFGELLPSAEAFIIDEAHQLPETAARFFGKSISSRQLKGLVSDVIAEQLRDAPDMPDLRELADELKISIQNFRLAMGEDKQRQAWQEIQLQSNVQQARKKLLDDLQNLAEALDVAAERGKGLEQCHLRCVLLQTSLKAYGNDSDEQAYIYWYETYAQGFVLNMTPLDVASLFKQHQTSLKGSWVFTSATLQVGKDFSHFAHSLGLEDYQQGNYKSPFNYPQQGLMFIPQGLPEPSSPDYTAQLIEQVIPVLEASNGRAFLLFTSYRAMNEAAQLLQGRIEFPILIQGSQPKHQLLEDFKDSGNAVLLGTGSFWEGVDVRGEALSFVMIDKLPFASPGDPVMQARLDAIRQQGGNSFMDYQLPQAVISLKQGSGRLIRDVSDTGVLMLADPRLYSKQYGKLFLSSLPNMSLTRELADVCDFYQYQAQQA